jgi:hypothetical protein
LILRASYATNWNQSRTAEVLNLKRDKLRYRMKLFNIRGENDLPESVGPESRTPEKNHGEAAA